MAIYETPNGKKRVQVEAGRNPITGKRDRKTITAKTSREAKAREHDLEIERAIKHGISDKITFGDFVYKLYLPSKKHLKKTTLSGYERDIRLRLIPAFGETLIGDINRMAIQYMLSSCPTYKVARNARETLRSILSEAVYNEIIRFNPASGQFKYPEKIKQGETDYGEWLTTFEEHKQVLDIAHGEKVEPLIILGLCFGLRKGEILGMEWRDIDYRKREITVRQTYTAARGKPELTTPKTLASHRTIPGADYAFERLNEIQNAGDTIPLGAICVNTVGNRYHPTSASKLMRDFVKKSGIKHITLMSLRHSFATAAVNAGIDIKRVSMWLGHTNVMTTWNRYVKPFMNDLHEDVETINNAYNGEKKCAIIVPYKISQL